ncbi:MAG: NAD(P)-dependent alcohol dehydrogenase [Gammaproteobacteria bacterium]|nr:NAD(P)-dependent alcohol dehydrogenase [Gammaproteobacteria bacterium]
MRAIVYKEYGAPRVLHVEAVETPRPQPDEVLIRIHAVEATKADCELRSFKFAVKWFWLPLRIAMGITRPKKPVLGGYFAGIIESVGEGVTKFNKGDEVFGCARLRMGAYGEYACLPADYTIVAKPGNLTFVEAAAVPLGGLNALHFLRKAKLRSGEKILINGAGGSIGSFAVQIARVIGAEVTAVDSVAKEQMLRAIGADHFFDYSTGDFASSGQTWDVIFDMVARSSYSACIKCLAPGGRYAMGNPRLSDMLRSVLTSAFSDKSAIFAFAGETEAELTELGEMIAAGKVKPVIDKVYSMEQAAAAHTRVETEQRLGIVVISMKNDESNGMSGEKE